MDIAELKRLTEAVTGWSNCSQAWLDTSEDVAAAVVGHIDEDGNTYPVITVDCEQYYSGDSIVLAHFYAAANPAVVLELIAELERLRAIVDSVSAVNLMRLQAENERLRTELADASRNLENSISLRWEAERNIAASQAREKVRIEALRVIAAHPDNDQGRTNWEAIVWESIGFAEAALALPTDDTALREMLVEAQEEMRERCAKVCDERSRRLHEQPLRRQHMHGGAIASSLCADDIRALGVKP